MGYVVFFVSVLGPEPLEVAVDQTFQHAGGGVLIWVGCRGGGSLV